LLEQNYPLRKTNTDRRILIIIHDGYYAFTIRKYVVPIQFSVLTFLYISKQSLVSTATNLILNINIDIEYKYKYRILFYYEFVT